MTKKVTYAPDRMAHLRAVEAAAREAMACDESQYPQSQVATDEVADDGVIEPVRAAARSVAG